MNREIKFRGKRLANDEWCYGSLLVWANGECTILEKSDSSNAVWKREIDPNTVGQFTGLYDKNGKEIYEGDILGTNESVIGWVKGGVRGYCYDVVYINHPAGESDWSLYGTVKYDYPGKIKVIGNIYDNKELLEETK